MKILHYYAEKNHLTAQQVEILKKELGGNVTVMTATTPRQASQALKSDAIDILHVHGCWRDNIVKVGRMARRHGTRIVVSPHGELEPWVIRRHYWRSKMPRIIAYQRQFVKSAYAVIVMGRMECGCMQRLGWNRRIVTVLNSIFTSATTDMEMARQTMAVYQKVMDTDPYQLLDENGRMAVASLIKAGITGDQRWLTPEESNCCRTLDDLAWRRILVHAYHCGISELISQGAQALFMVPPDIHPERIDCFPPKKSVEKEESDESPDRPEAWADYFHHLRKRMRQGRLTILDIVQLSTRLRQSYIKEDTLAQLLEERKLLSFCSAIMQVTVELTRLEEGFLIVPPRQGRLSRKIESIVTHQLSL